MNTGYLVRGRAGVVELEHRLIVEKAVGHPIPKGAEIHHVNGNRLDNSRGNLVLCPDHAYHVLLHRRTEALKATGDPGKIRCAICKQWDAPEKVTHTSPRIWFTHRECRREYHRNKSREKAARKVATC